MPAPGAQHATNDDRSFVSRAIVAAASKKISENTPSEKMPTEHMPTEKQPSEKRPTAAKSRAKRVPAQRAVAVTTKEIQVEVKIGVQYAPRELVVETNEPLEEVEKAIAAALTGGSKTLALSDDKGRRVIVPTDKIAYIEISEITGRTVGFTAG